MKKQILLFAGITTYIVVFLLFGGIFLLLAKPGHHEQPHMTAIPSKLLAVEADKILARLNTHGIQVTVSANETADGSGTPAKTTKTLGTDRFMIDLEATSFVYDGIVDTVFLKKVMSHEFMHVLSLQNSQISTPSNLTKSGEKINTQIFDTEELACRPQYYNLQGCFSQSSYVSLFYQTFWAGSTQEEYDTIQRIQDKKEFSTQLIRWGQQHKDMFVSQTAFTSPEEDLAESFSIWMKGENSDEATPVQKNKIHFFDLYPELLQMRALFLNG